MNDDIEKIYAKLVAHETEIINLRKGYMIINERYTKALVSLKQLTNSAAEAAKKACLAAEKANFATAQCFTAAKEAANQSVIEAAEAAAEAANFSAEAAIEAAAATKRAAEAAADAVKMANAAAATAKGLRDK